jgi:hypothetical protein
LLPGGGWKPFEGGGFQFPVERFYPALSCPPENTGQQGNHQECQEDEEQDLGNAGGCSRDAAEAKGTGYDRHDKKHQRPVKHRSNSFISVRAFQYGHISVRAFPCRHLLAGKTIAGCIGSAAGQKSNQAAALA